MALSSEVSAIFKGRAGRLSKVADVKAPRVVVDDSGPIDPAPLPSPVPSPSSPPAPVPVPASSPTTDDAPLRRRRG